MRPTPWQTVNTVLVCSPVCPSALWTDEGPQRDPAELIHAAKHTGAVGYKIWEKMQTQVQCRE